MGRCGGNGCGRWGRLESWRGGAERIFVWCRPALSRLYQPAAPCMGNTDMTVRPFTAVESKLAMTIAARSGGRKGQTSSDSGTSLPYLSALTS